MVPGVVPPIAPGAGKLVTFAEPSKFDPPMVRVVVSVAALPVVFWFSVGKVQFVSVPLVGVPRMGVTSVGEVASTSTVPLPVVVISPSVPALS